MASRNQTRRETVRYTIRLADGRSTEQVFTADGSVVDAGDPSVMAETHRLLLWHSHGLPAPPSGQCQQHQIGDAA